jgi:hypothetical protein
MFWSAAAHAGAHLCMPVCCPTTIPAACRNHNCLDISPLFHLASQVRSLQEMLQLVAPAAAAVSAGAAPPPLRQQVVDVRSAGRFKGVEPEPRAGLRGGHMPGALNVPFTQVSGRTTTWCCFQRHMTVVFGAQVLGGQVPHSLEISARQQGTVLLQLWRRT